MRQFSNAQFRYDPEKNSKLLTERQIGFDEIAAAMLEGKVLAVTDHFNKERYPNQQIAYVFILDIVYKVPFIEEGENSIFLKTAYPSSKARDEFFPNKKKNKS
ncbi:MAG: hypothetical protein AABY27_03700 [Pseudomonadota bacterium]